MRLFDTHAHYFDSRFADGADGAETLLAEIFSGDVDRIVNVGTNLENSIVCLEMAQKYTGLYAAVGIHPSDCADMPFSAVSEFSDFLQKHSDFVSHKIVAIGEIGLDYHFEPFDKEKQKSFFREQMKMAMQWDLPVIIHDRDAHGDCFDMALEFPKVRGVFHCYSGSVEMARELVRRGWYISFAGPVTYKNADRIREAAASIPDDRLLIETDCPYLAPHPMRGKLNHSGYLHYTAEAVAAARGISTEALAALTHKNANRLFGL